MRVELLVDDFLVRAAALYPDKNAVVDGAVRLTYTKLQARVFQMANALLDLGVTKGERVCILSPNSHFFLESFYATSRIGAVLVPLNYRLVAADHEYILNHAGVSVILADLEQVPIVDSIRDRLPAVKHWVVAKDDGETPEGWLDWNEWIAPASSSAPEPVDRVEDDLVSINYTSGTTARPKGVMLTHRNCYLNAYGLIAHLRVSHEDVELWTLPMFHCNGWGGVYALTGMGGTHVILRKIDAGEIFGLIEREGVTFACMAPAVLRTILDYEHRDRHQIETKPRFTIAGAPPPAAFVERLEKELGWHFMQIYGLTETSPLLTVSFPQHGIDASDYSRRARAGVTALGVELRVADDLGDPVPRDDESVGEVLAKSNVVFAGYYQQPDETSEAMRDGWFHTGDLATWDATGNIHIVDRKKDVIISGGENISSPEIEDVLYRHPDVLECAVIGVPDEKWGETPLALFVVREGSSLSEEELDRYCREHIAGFKRPRKFERVDALPRTATGKLQKFKLRERYWSSDRRVN